MDYAAHAPHVHVSRGATAVLAAFVIGGGAAVGVVALSGGLSSSEETQSPTLIIHSTQGGQSAGALDQQVGARP